MPAHLIGSVRAIFELLFCQEQNKLTLYFIDSQMRYPKKHLNTYDTDKVNLSDIYIIQHFNRIASSLTGVSIPSEIMSIMF